MDHFPYSSNPPRFTQSGSGGESFLYSGDQMTKINPIGGPALSINDAGQVVGGQFTSINASGQYVGSPGAGVLTSGTNTVSPIYANNPATSELVQGSSVIIFPSVFAPYSLNNNGQVAGTLVVPSGGGTAFDPAVWSNGKVTDLSTSFGGVVSNGRAIAINQSGMMLINLALTGANNTASYLYNPSTGTCINIQNLPGGTGMVGSALNDTNQVVGNGFLYSNGMIHTLTSLIPPVSGWSNLNATGINDKGQIVGQGLINGQEQAFLMTPGGTQVPEPGTLAMWGLVAVGAAMRMVARRRPTL